MAQGKFASPAAAAAAASAAAAFFDSAFTFHSVGETFLKAVQQQADLVSSGAMGDETASRDEHEHATSGTSKEDRKLEG